MGTGTVTIIVLLVFLVTTKVNRSAHRTLTLQWFFVDLSHRLSAALSFSSSLFLSSRTMDRGWQEKIGPQGIGNLSVIVSKTNQSSQRGLIKRYISSSILSVTTILVLFLI